MVAHQISSSTSELLIRYGRFSRICQLYIALTAYLLLRDGYGGYPDAFNAVFHSSFFQRMFYRLFLSIAVFGAVGTDAYSALLLYRELGLRGVYKLYPIRRKLLGVPLWRFLLGILPWVGALEVAILLIAIITH